MAPCLNPCFNGRYSQSSGRRSKNLIGLRVLILVLMEDTLRVYKRSDDFLIDVLILVLMEDTLRAL